MTISWIEQDEYSYLHEITINKNSIVFDITDKDGDLIDGEELEVSPQFTEILKRVLSGEQDYNKNNS